ncbi:MAG: DUF1822 family protein [Cyanobacteria bacterium P01_A01_bin.68]
MISTNEYFGFRVTLSPEAQLVAEKFQRYQDNFHKGEQVYRNTLAVYAVHLHLQNLGFKPDLEASNSWDFVSQTLMDVADLEIRNYGKIECRPVLPDEEFIQIPEEVWFESTYCIAVEIEEIATEAKLLGFVEEVTTDKISRSQLRPLEELPALLERNINKIKLSQWLEGIFQKDWQPTEKVLAYRRELTLGKPRTDKKQPVSRTKKIDLGLLINKKSVALVVTITPQTDDKTEVLVQVIPMDRYEYLPSDIGLKIVLESETAEIRAREADNIIQLKFIEPPRSQFTVQISLGDAVVTENFII